MLLYIPIWFYSNLFPDSLYTDPKELYIPIWFYSNTLNSFVSLASLNFTFQSGSIQIDFRCVLWHSWRNFTFQSGSIQMILIIFIYSEVNIFTFQSGSIQIYQPEASVEPYYAALHSNLVLFKWWVLQQWKLYNFNFTFQSGSIQMVYFKTWRLGNLHFTFQSGSIQIETGDQTKAFFIALHSNLVLFK